MGESLGDCILSLRIHESVVVIKYNGGPVVGGARVMDGARKIGETLQIF